MDYSTKNYFKEIFFIKVFKNPQLVQTSLFDNPKFSLNVLENQNLFSCHYHMGSMSWASKVVTITLKGFLQPLKTLNYALFEIPKNLISTCQKPYIKPQKPYCRLPKKTFIKPS